MAVKGLLKFQSTQPSCGKSGFEPTHPFLSSWTYVRGSLELWRGTKQAGMAVKRKGFAVDARRLLVLVGLVVVALVALPAAADAKTVEFRGVVSGSPYGASNGYMAVPVLYSKQTLRYQRLKSPVGLLMVKRQLKVKLPNGAPKIVPVNLRTGDRFKGKVVMKSIYQRTFYPRVQFSQVTVYFRSKELSTAELNAAIQKLQGDVARLTTWLAQLTNYTTSNFADVRAQIAELRASLNALRTDLDALKASLAGIQKQIDDLAKKLQDQIDALKGQLNGVVGQLQGVLTAITNLQSSLTSLTARVAALEATVGQLVNDIGLLSGQGGTLTSTLNNI